MFLVVVVLATITLQGQSSRDVLDEGLTIFERGIRFGTDEATLRNSLVRVRVLLDENPQEVVVEYAATSDIVISTAQNDSVQSLAEEEAAEKAQKALDQKFRRVSEFQAKNVKLPETIRVIGVGSTLNNSFLTSGDASVYFYPTGERDNAIIILGSEDEIAALKIPAFLPELNREYDLTPRGNVNEFNDPQLDKAKEVYQAWARQ